MIFERHFEDDKDTTNDTTQNKQDNIDAEPYKFLE